jgi:hypothetical protein
VIAFLFPGQGAQEVGMGRALSETHPVARETFDEANEILGYDLAAICFEGPIERLTATEVCQPALVTASVAAWRVAGEAGLRAELVMGHSLGEYSALVAAGSMGFSDAVRIVAERGAAMEEAAAATSGTMAAVLGPTDAEVEALCAEIGDCWPANYNCPGQVVVSGTTPAIERLLGLAAERGAKAVRLAVGGATSIFHSRTRRNVESDDSRNGSHGPTYFVCWLGARFFSAVHARGACFWPLRASRTGENCGGENERDRRGRIVGAKFGDTSFCRSHRPRPKSREPRVSVFDAEQLHHLERTVLRAQPF